MAPSPTGETPPRCVSAGKGGHACISGKGAQPFGKGGGVDTCSLTLVTQEVRGPNTFPY